MLQIRPYRPAEDSVSLRACLVELQEWERSVEPRRPRGEEIADAYVARMHEWCVKFEGVILMAEEDGQVVGFACALSRVQQEDLDEDPSDYACVSDLVVRSGSRGHGVGTALLRAAEDFARARGASFLHIGVLARNEGARRLYLREGFSEYQVRLVKSLVG